jgi:hypothetical protein
MADPIQGFVQVPSLYFQHLTPLWCEHAPLPVAVLAVPSMQIAPTRTRCAALANCIIERDAISTPASNRQFNLTVCSVSSSPAVERECDAEHRDRRSTQGVQP